MRPFGGDDEEFQELFPYDEEEEFVDEYIGASDAIQVAQIELARYDLRQRLLYRCIEMVDEGFFSKFRKHDKKIEMIQNTYKTFASLIDDGYDEESLPFDLEIEVIRDDEVEDEIEDEKENEQKEE